MILDCAVYKDGERLQASDDLSDALEQARSCDGFLWLGLVDPGLDELTTVANELGLHPLAVEDAVKAHQRAKLETFTDSVFMVLKTLRSVEDNARVAVNEISMFYSPSFIVTVRHGAANPLHDVRLRLEERRDLLAHGTSAVVYAVLDAVVDSYVELAAELQEAMDDLEAQVFAPGRGDYAEQIYRLKRTVTRVQRAVVPLADPVGSLVEGDVGYVPSEVRPFLRDVHDHLLRTTDEVREWNALLSQILDANVARVSLRQNDDMRRISAWAAMAAVPTLIAGIYGMNFTWMPELKLHYGYPIVLVVMLVLCVVLYRAFKKSGWL